MKRLVLVTHVAFLLFIFQSCEEVDDQTIVPKNALQSVNPEPLARDFIANNERHKVLMAVIDTGTDYNHPAIANNIHFDIKDGKVIGAGYDFIGEDTWASPYVAVTSAFNKEASNEEVEKGQRVITRTKELFQRFPKLRAYFDPNRNLTQEIEAGTYHGTHVGGLMVYDEPNLGLIPYRVLPKNKKFKDGNLTSTDSKEIVFAHIVEAIKLAAARKVRVVNLSLGMKTREQGSSLADKEDFEKFKTKMNVLEELIKQNPQIAFVAAAGNEGQWINGKSALQLPCGINAPNVLCVGALDKHNQLASFSNISLLDTPFVLAPGADILSLYPSKMCNAKRLDWLDDQEESYPFRSRQSTLDFYDDLASSCAESNGYKRSSGTSMAAPIVARMVGKLFLKEPELSGAQAIAKLVGSGDNFSSGPMNFKRLYVERPSWYPEGITRGPLLNGINFSNKSQSGYFELITHDPNPGLDL